MSLRTLLAGAMLALAALAAGCVSPFQPATPEVSSGAGVIAKYSTPEELLQTMADAITAQSASGRSAYNGAIADSVALGTREFYAIPYPAVKDLWTNPTDPWTSVFEKRLYDYLMTVEQTFTYTLEWDPDNSRPSNTIDEAAGIATYHQKYTLSATSPDGVEIKAIAIGYADLYMQKLNSRWYLYRWEDRIDPDVGVLPADASSYSMGWRRLDSSH